MPQEWTPQTILDAVRAAMPAGVIVAAAELDMFSILSGAPQSADQLASRMNADLRATRILADALVAMGLLSKAQSRYSVPADVAQSLSKTSPANVLASVRHLGNCTRRWARLAEIAKNGPLPRPPSILGEAEDQASFITAMNDFTASIAADVVAKLGFLQFNCVLDIGGASGTWTIEFLRAAPEARAILFDLPGVVPMASERLDAAGLAERVTLVAGDYNTDELPVGADFAWLSAVAHQNSRAENVALYEKIFRALSPGGTLVIRDVVMDWTHTRPVGGAMFAINMLANTEAGGTYSLDESAQDLTAAGFERIELIHEDEFMNSLIRATKPL